MPRSTRPSLPLAPPSKPCPLINHADRMEYRIGRGETSVLTFEPYKSYLLPLWRFRTPQIAGQSSKLLWDEFEAFGDRKDFVGMDMARKFIQMGYTRSKRYANHKGGRKYDDDKQILPKSEGHSDKEDKEEASRIFKKTWEKCRADETYLRLKGDFQKEQKAWDKEHKTAVKKELEAWGKEHKTAVKEEKTEQKAWDKEHKTTVKKEKEEGKVKKEETD